MITEQLIEQLMRHEGYRDKVYKCPAGKDTIGYGYNLEANPENISDRGIEQLYKKGITKDFAKELLMVCLTRLEHELRNKLPWLGKLNGARQAVLINMSYNLGVEGLLKFRMTLRNIEIQNWEAAELCLRASLWHKQVGKRALELEKQLVLGKYSEEK